MFGSELRFVPEFGGLERAAIRIYGSLSAPTATRYTRFKYFGLKFLRHRGVRPAKILDYGCAYGAFGFDLALELDAASAGMRSDRAALIARSRTLPT